MSQVNVRIRPLNENDLNDWFRMRKLLWDATTDDIHKTEMLEILVERKHDACCQCLARKLLTYALGRELQSFDRCAVNNIVGHLQKEDYRFSALVTSIVLSDPFRMRESKGDN